MKLALFLVLFLTACGDWTPMDCPDTVKTATITWERTDPGTTCEKLGAATLDRGGACISVSIAGDASVATLYAEAPDKMDDMILGHEVKHAFGCKHA